MNPPNPNLAGLNPDLAGLNPHENHEFHHKLEKKGLISSRSTSDTNRKRRNIRRMAGCVRSSVAFFSDILESFSQYKVQLITLIMWVVYEGAQCHEFINDKLYDKKYVSVRRVSSSTNKFSEVSRRRVAVKPFVPDDQVSVESSFFLLMI